MFVGAPLCESVCRNAPAKIKNIIFSIQEFWDVYRSSLYRQRSSVGTVLFPPVSSCWQVHMSDSFISESPPCSPTSEVVLRCWGWEQEAFAVNRMPPKSRAPTLLVTLTLLLPLGRTHKRNMFTSSLVLTSSVFGKHGVPSECVVRPLKYGNTILCKQHLSSGM